MAGAGQARWGGGSLHRRGLLWNLGEEALGLNEGPTSAETWLFSPL